MNNMHGVQSIKLAVITFVNLSFRGKYMGYTPTQKNKKEISMVITSTNVTIKTGCFTAQGFPRQRRREAKLCVMVQSDWTRRSTASSASVPAWRKGGHQIKKKKHKIHNTCNISEVILILTRQREGHLLYWSIRKSTVVPFRWITAEKRK
jgi:hypothetical protein